MEASTKNDKKCFFGIVKKNSQVFALKISLCNTFHRYMFDDDNLPDWFAEDERKHLKRQRIVTKVPDVLNS